MADQDQGVVRYEIKNKIGIATLNRPGRLNALSRKMLDDLKSIVDGIQSWEKVRVLVIPYRSSPLLTDSLWEADWKSAWHVISFLRARKRNWVSPRPTWVLSRDGAAASGCQDE